MEKNEPAHDKTYKMVCAPGEDLDQPWHPPSLISLHCTHWVAKDLSFLHGTAKTDQTGISGFSRTRVN